jgi:hypothetical protein
VDNTVEGVREVVTKSEAVLEKGGELRVAGY